MKSFARFLKFLLLMTLVLAGFVFSLRNATPVSLWLGLDFAPRPVGLWMLLSFICGALLGMVLGYGLWRRVRMGMQLRHLKSELSKCQQELLSLKQQQADMSRRNLP